MAFNFRRSKKTDAQVPEEVQQYYQSERRERTGVAWLLALGTLLITLAIAFALFWAGRWVYRAITDGDDGQKSPQITQPVSEESKSDTSSTSTNTPSASAPTTTAPAPAAGTNSTTPATSPATTPVTGPTELVNTGPDGE